MSAFSRAFTTTNPITMPQIRKETDRKLRKSKIVCTIGPSCWSVEMLEKMIATGMNVARLNFSHGDHAGHGAVVGRLRQALENRAKKGFTDNIAVMLDTKGPEIRTGFFAEGKTITLKAGQDLELTTDYSFKGNNKKLAVSYPAMPTTVKVGQTILCADGSLVMTVNKLLKTGVIVTCVNDATIGERKNMNLPGVVVDLPTVTEKDKSDIVDFGLKYNVDMIALSFVRKGSDLTLVRKLLGPKGAHIKLISKIENQEGLDNYDSILKETDGIMVARGDLGMEIAPQKVFLAQKMMIHKANMAGKPVITATQMLESMCSKPRPTRAECTDVANAVLDGSDCVMCSGETAGGDYPLNAVDIMACVCVEAEGALNYNQLFSQIRSSVVDSGSGTSVQEALAAAAVSTANQAGAKLIAVTTETGATATLIAKYRPQAAILVLTSNAATARQVSGLLRGVTAEVLGSTSGCDAVPVGKARGIVQKGDTVVTVTNDAIKVVTVQ